MLSSADWYYTILVILALLSDQLIAYHYTRLPHKRKEMRQNMRSTLGKFYLTGAFALAGTSVITGYVLSEKLSGFTITAVSMGVVLAGLLPFYFRKTLRAIRALTGRDWLTLAAQAVFGIFLFRMFLLLGVRQTSATEAGILTGTTPAITAAMAFFILRERPSGFSAAGIAATVAGIILLQGGGLFAANFASGHLLGNALVLLAAASESAFNIIARSQMAGASRSARVALHPMVQTLLVSAMTFCLCAVPALLERPFAALSTLGLREWFALAWYGLAVTALAFAFFYAGARRCGAYAIAAFSGLMPLTAMLLSILLLREHEGLLQWTGCLLILLGMLLIGRNRKSAMMV
jgi:drug/metabolite transporter (DMT)-like permease